MNKSGCNPLGLALSFGFQKMLHISIQGMQVMQNPLSVATQFQPKPGGLLTIFADLFLDIVNLSVGGDSRYSLSDFSSTTRTPYQEFGSIQI